MIVDAAGSFMVLRRSYYVHVVSEVAMNGERCDFVSRFDFGLEDWKIVPNAATLPFHSLHSSFLSFESI